MNKASNVGLEQAVLHGRKVLIKYLPMQFDLIGSQNLKDITIHRFQFKSFLDEYKWILILQHLQMGPIIFGWIEDRQHQRLGLILEFIPGSFYHSKSMSQLPSSEIPQLHRILKHLDDFAIQATDFQFIMHSHEKRIYVIDPGYYSFMDNFDPGITPMAILQDTNEYPY